QKVFHEVEEDRQRATRADHVIAERFLSAGITHPRAGNISWRITDEPNVGMVVDRAGLAGEGNAERLRPRSGTALHYAAHHPNHGQRDVFAYDFVSSPFPLFHDRAVTIQNLANHVGFDANAFVWKC